MGAERSLVLASGNPGKLRELAELLKPLGYGVRPQADWSIEEAVENGCSFIENALIKARHAARACGLPAIADDSGLVVPVLEGAPGIHSARFAGQSAGDADNNRKLLAALSGMRGEDRRAYFHCAMVMVQSADDPVPLVASASWWGHLLDSPRGDGGFGYDPLFFVAEQDCTSAELPAEVKNRLSHRGQALRALLQELRRHAEGAA
jgi:XTP/dITP diphosphohydrolase